MQLVEIEEDQKNIWNRFIAENNSECFLQSWEWGDFQCSLGRKVRRIGVVEEDRSFEKVFKTQIPNSQPQDAGRPKMSSLNQVQGRLLSGAKDPVEDNNALYNGTLRQAQSDNHKNQTFSDSLKSQSQNSGTRILAVALLIKHNLPFGMSYLYCPRGPVVEKSPPKADAPLAQKLKSLSRAEQRDQRSKILELLFSGINEIAKMEKSMFLKIEPLTESDCELPKGFRKSNMDIQPKNTLMLDLSKSEEELLAGMKQKTRYNIRLAERKGVQIKNYELRTTNNEEFKNNFDEFWKLTSETSRRDGFKPHDRDYYWKMLEVFGKPDVIARSACLFGRQEVTKQSQTVGLNSGLPHSFQSLAMTNFSIPEQSMTAKLYLARYEGRIIAANIVLFFSDIAIYLHGASSDEDRNVMAPYLLQWKQILDAQELGCKKYDFWGITVDGEKKTWKGITRFKKGFGGFEKRYSGSFDIVYDKMSYFGYGVIKKIRKIF